MNDNATDTMSRNFNWGKGLGENMLRIIAALGRLFGKKKNYLDHLHITKKYLNHGQSSLNIKII